jgi:hypothetical protein
MKKNIYKISGFIITLSVITALITPLFASAQTVDSTSSLSTQVQSLLNQISILESQLKSVVSSNMSSTSMMMRQDSNNPSMTNMMGTSTSMMSGMGAMRCLPIMRDLSQGSSGDDVSGLQQVLAADGFLSASSTTGYFGPLTARAVMQFQSQFGIASSYEVVAVKGKMEAPVWVMARLRLRCGKKVAQQR